MGGQASRKDERKIESVTGPTLWWGEELGRRQSWIHHFTAQEIGEVEAALRGVQARGLALLEITREDFPLPSLEPMYERVLQELEGGRSLQLMRGLPMDQYTPRETGIIYWGMGRVMGKAVAQEFDGHNFGHVYDRGKEFTLETARA